MRIQELIGVKFVLIIRVNNSITLEISTGELDGINNGIFFLFQKLAKNCNFLTQFYIAYIYGKKIEMFFDFNHMDKKIDESQLDEIKHYNDFMINQFLATQESVQIFQKIEFSV